MTPTTEQLRQADCLFAIDRVRDPAMTAFKQTARYRQHRWAIERGVTEFGAHPNPRRLDASGQPTKVRNGTKLSTADAASGMNFFSEEIRAAVEHRLSREGRQPYETLNSTRLRGDLLSSMPMAFNLFGEAVEHAESARALADLMAPGVRGAVEVTFEWSPRRRSLDYTNDRTAFDVALLIGDTNPRTVVGIETKYHEHSTREPRPKDKERHGAQTEFLARIADDSGVFVEGWRDAVLETDLRQIWRDHLLALSMRKHQAEWTRECRYVLVYPSANVSYADAATRYAEVLRPDDSSFQHLTIESLLDAAFGHDATTGAAFRDRYLW